MADDGRRSSSPAARWVDLGGIVAAHLVMLRDAAIIDDQALAAALSPLDGVVRGEPRGVTLDETIAAFDGRLDALVAPGVVGAPTLGRSRLDTAAALARLSLRPGLLELSRSSDDARRAMIELAAQHAATTMPAYAGSQPVQPTALGHFLGATIGPLGRAIARISAAFDSVNRSPLGAVALASTNLPIARERVAALLGFDGLVENTFDAVAATDHVVEAVEAAAAVAAPLGRLVTELLAWLRTEPDSLRLGDAWVGSEPGLPQIQRPVGLERLLLLARRVESAAAEATALGAGAPYEPLGPALDDLLRAALTAVQTAADLGDAVAALLNGGLEANRASLANRAGRAYTTASDLATFLMTEEGLDPAAAANVAALTISRARNEGVEISGVTPQMIDAAALLVIGRELGVEFEAISRHLAPRRFLEGRTATGGPAPSAVRAQLDQERRRADEATRWRLTAEGLLATAERELNRLVVEGLANAD